MIVAARDEEAEPLTRCLNNISPHVDGIFLTITGHNEKLEQIAQLYNCTVSHFDWINDFSAARNFNFQQVTPDYTHILWLDADDIIRNGEKIKPTLESHPEVDAFTIFYSYSFDEFKNPNVVHQKTQIIRNDNFVTWVGRLHEDFKPNREFSIYLLKGVERLHLTDDFRINSAKGRNLKIAEQQLIDEPKDPRSFWNVANALKACDSHEPAIEFFNKFLAMSQSDDEKYIARLRIAESYWALGKHPEAIAEAQSALGIKPHYPDAYHILGNLFFDTHAYEKARDSYLMGLSMRPPIYSIIVYNPREYDYQPLYNLAQTYFKLQLPQMALPCLEACLKVVPKDTRIKNLVKEMKPLAEKAEKVYKIAGKLKKIKDKDKLREALNNVADEFKSHPLICNIRNVNFIQETSTGKDVTIFCGYTDEMWTPDTAKATGIGGSEEAVIHLSQGLAEKGWNVTVFNNCGHQAQKFGDVTYKPFWTWNYRDKQDVVIYWRSPRCLEYDVNCPNVFLDLHDVVSPGEFTDKRLLKVKKIFVKSKFHRSLFPAVPNDKFEIIPNGIDAELFGHNVSSAPRDNKLLINTSSPDRSLAGLLKAYEKIKAEVPDVKLKWCYGWGVFDTVYSDTPQMQEWKKTMQAKMKELGVEELGRLSHNDVAKLYMQAGIFAYPSEFAEIDCISLSKAMAGGAIPVTTDFAAMGEKQGFGVFVHSDKTKDNWTENYKFDFSLQNTDEWAEKVIELLKNPPTEEQRLEMCKWAQDRFDWNKVIEQWDGIIK